jgi:hypothetical protein
MLTLRERLSDQLQTAFPFTVDKMPLQGPDNIRSPFYGMLRSDNSEFIGGTVKQGYTPHELEDVITLAEAAVGGFDDECEVNCWFNKGHRISIAPSKAFRRSIFGTQDGVFPRVNIVAGFGTSVLGDLNVFRDACSNMMEVKPEGVGVSANIRHTSGLRGKLDSLTQDFSHLVSNWDNLVDGIRAMDAQKVDLAAFMMEIFPTDADATKVAVRHQREAIEACVLRIQQERVVTGRLAMELGKATAWEAFNGVQGYVQHTAARRKNLSTQGRIDKAFESSVVAKAHALALAA